MFTIASVGCPLPRRFAQGPQRVRRLARLAQHEHQCLLLERRVAIAELAGKLDLHRHVRQPLDQILPHERRMPARAASRKHNPPHPSQPRGAQVQSAEPGRRFRPAHPAPARVDHGLRLFADFLDHVVRVPAQLDRVRLPVDAIDPRRDRPMLDMADLEITRRQPNHLAILQISHPRRVRRDRHRVARKQVLAFTQAHDQRAAKPCADDDPRLLFAHHREPISPLQPLRAPAAARRTDRSPIPARAR